MTNVRYIILLSLLIAAAVIGFMWPQQQEPTISFTRPATDANEEVQLAETLSSLESLARTSDDQAEDQSAAIKLIDREPRVVSNQRPLSKQELANQISLARQKLAQVEALNARKQAQVERILAQEDSGERALIEAELAYRIGGWRQAWRSGDTNGYFAHYSDQFTPSDGRTLEQWKALRVKRLNPSAPIDLDLEDFEVSFDSVTQRSLVTFTQFYKSGNYQDKIKKRLILANEKGQWNIVSETQQ